MATLAVQASGESGLNPTYTAAAAGGDAFANTNGNVFLHVKNGGGSSITVTVPARITTITDAQRGVVTKADASATIAAAGAQMIGPFKPLSFNDATGKASITYSAVTSV